MPESYFVRIDKEYLVFSAAHFITFNGNVCERLHGHNYRVCCEVRGALDENSYVIDFIDLRDALKRLVDELDHRVLLPTQHPQIRVTWDDREATAVFEDRRWVFPRGDCALLPVANTTAELIARYVGHRLLDDLEQHTGARPHFVRLGIDENFGQWGFCELEGE